MNRKILLLAITSTVFGSYSAYAKTTEISEECQELFTKGDNERLSEYPTTLESAIEITNQMKKAN